MLELDYPPTIMRSYKISELPIPSSYLLLRFIQLISPLQHDGRPSEETFHLDQDLSMAGRSKREIKITITIPTMMGLGGVSSYLQLLVVIVYKMGGQDVILAL